MAELFATVWVMLNVEHFNMLTKEASNKRALKKFRPRGHKQKHARCQVVLENAHTRYIHLAKITKAKRLIISPVIDASERRCDVKKKKRKYFSCEHFKSQIEHEKKIKHVFETTVTV